VCISKQKYATPSDKCLEFAIVTSYYSVLREFDLGTVIGWFNGRGTATVPSSNSASALLLLLLLEESTAAYVVVVVDAADPLKRRLASMVGSEGEAAGLKDDGSLWSGRRKHGNKSVMSTGEIKLQPRTHKKSVLPSPDQPGHSWQLCAQN